MAAALEQTGKKENQQNALPVAKLAQKESVVFAGNALSSSKIPLLSKNGGPPERKQLHRQQSWFQQMCASSCRSKAIKNPKGSAPGDGGLEPAAALLPKSLSREPLGEVQLSTSGHRNEGSMSDGKGTDPSGRED
ncbi:hypothetical protein JD844_011200 [Phrynosoma platyrhinos]|uniref:Kinesin family member 24 n=1 Tax=Phrynosoma platyrhinos TaxID=52577 RepID=A0ABQ7THL8_PHRPL|nr:hypothetical protein JD844_011200 [Phrynosoma platyrhinos]